MPLGQVIAFDAARGAPESLQPLLDIVSADMEAINRIILDKAVSDVELIPELAHHLIDSGGKRLRPMLAIAASKLCDYRRPGTYPRRLGDRVHAHGDAAARRCRR